MCVCVLGGGSGKRTYHRAVDTRELSFYLYFCIRVHICVRERGRVCLCMCVHSCMKKKTDDQQSNIIVGQYCWIVGRQFFGSDHVCLYLLLWVICKKYPLYKCSLRECFDKKKLTTNNPTIKFRSSCRDTFPLIFWIRYFILWCVYVYILTHLHIHMNTCTYIHTCGCVCMYTLICACICICIYVCIFVMCLS